MKHWRNVTYRRIVVLGRVVMLEERRRRIDLFYPKFREGWTGRRL